MVNLYALLRPYDEFTKSNCCHNVHYQNKPIDRFQKFKISLLIDSKNSIFSLHTQLKICNVATLYYKNINFLIKAYRCCCLGLTERTTSNFMHARVAEHI